MTTTCALIESAREMRHKAATAVERLSHEKENNIVEKTSNVAALALARELEDRFLRRIILRWKHYNESFGRSKRISEGIGNIPHATATSTSSSFNDLHELLLHMRERSKLTAQLLSSPEARKDKLALHDNSFTTLAISTAKIETTLTTTSTTKSKHIVAASATTKMSSLSGGEEMQPSLQIARNLTHDRSQLQKHILSSSDTIQDNFAPSSEISTTLPKAPSTIPMMMVPEEATRIKATATMGHSLHCAKGTEQSSTCMNKFQHRTATSITDQQVKPPLIKRQSMSFFRHQSAFSGGARNTYSAETRKPQTTSAISKYLQISSPLKKSNTYPHTSSLLKLISQFPSNNNDESSSSSFSSSSSSSSSSTSSSSSSASQPTQTQQLSSSSLMSSRRESVAYPHTHALLALTSQIPSSNYDGGHHCNIGSLSSPLFEASKPCPSPPPSSLSRSHCTGLSSTLPSFLLDATSTSISSLLRQPDFRMVESELLSLEMKLR